MNYTGVGQTGCACALEYEDRWPDMSPAELAHVHAARCPVRLRRLERERRRARDARRARPARGPIPLPRRG